MKNKKGFTLVELMAVIVILALIISVAVPSALAISKRIKNKMYDTKVDMIEKASELFAQEKTNNIGTKACFKTQLLINKGYLKKDNNDSVIDPRDNSSLNEKFVCVKKENRRYIAKFDADPNDYDNNIYDGSKPAVAKKISELDIGSYVYVPIGNYGKEPAIESLKNWIIISNDGNTVEAVSKNVYSNYCFTGVDGYKKYAQSLYNAIFRKTSIQNNLMKKMRTMGYNNQQLNITSKLNTIAEIEASIDDLYLNDYNKVKSAIGTAVATNTSGAVSPYWVPSRNYTKGYNPNLTLLYINTSGNVSNASVREQLEKAGQKYWQDKSVCNPVRMIITLNPDIEVLSGSGTESNPYKFE